MKQVYFSNTTTGKAAPRGNSEVQVRGASTGLAERHLAAAARYANYAAPAMPPGAAVGYLPPVRLAWLDTPDAGRLLCHSTCLGIDPATGRNGHFFSHVLIDVPGTLDAQHAIQTWGSHLWQRVDHSGAAALPEPLYLPVSSALGDARLQEFLTQPANRELFQFVLAAALEAAQRRIFVAAPAEDVALCVYGITRTLPAALVDDFTFSTYEHDPLTCPARLIGACWAEGEARDLPAACYENAGVGFNSWTGRRSAGVAAGAFVEFAVEALANGQLAALQEFHTTWQRLGVQDARMLDLVYRLSRGTGALTRDEWQQVLQHPTLGAWIAAGPDALQQLVSWALEDNAFATGTFSRAVAVLRQKPETLTQLTQLVEQQGLAALRSGDLARTRSALEVLLPMAAPARAAVVWSELLTTLSNPETLSWDMRCYLLPHLARLHGAATPPATVLGPWLRSDPDRLAELLQLNLPHPYQVTICLEALQQDGPTPALAAILARSPELFLAVLTQSAETPADAARVEALCEAMLAASPERGWIDAVIQHGEELPVALVNRCLETALEKEAVAVAALVRAHGPALLHLLTGQPGLDRLARRLLEQSADELLSDPAIGTFLHGLATQANLPGEVRERLDACLTVQTFMKQASLDSAILARVMAALKLDPPLFPPQTLSRVVEAIAVELPNHPDMQPELEAVLLTVGPHTVGGPSGLFRELLHRRAKQKGFWKQTELLRAFLAIALGAPQSAELAARLDNLEAEAFSLAKQMGLQGGKRVLSAVEQHAASWPRAAQTQWHFLAKAVQPRGLREVLRDAGIFLGGAAVMFAVVQGMRWLGML